VNDTLPDLKGWKIAWSMDRGVLDIRASVENKRIAALRFPVDLGAVV